MDTIYKKSFSFFFTLHWVYRECCIGIYVMGMRIRIYCTVYNVHNTQILSFYNILSPFVVPFLLRGFPPSPSILFFGLPVTYVQQLYNLSQNLDILSICLFYIIALVVYALKCMPTARNILSCDHKYIYY